MTQLSLFLPVQKHMLQYEVYFNSDMDRHWIRFCLGTKCRFKITSAVCSVIEKFSVDSKPLSLAYE